MTKNDPERSTKVERRARNTQWTLKGTLALFGFVVLFMAIGATLTFWRKPTAEPNGVIAFFVLFGLLMFFVVRFEKAYQVFEKSYASYMDFLSMVLRVFAPLFLFTWLSRITLEKLPLWAQIIIFFLWGVLLGGALLLIATKEKRKRFRAKWERVHLLMPIAYGVMVLMLALLFFSSVTFVITKHGLLSLKDVAGRGVTPGALNDFFLWHFLEAIPLLKINETLRWAAPLAYDTPQVGWVLLFFKVAVIVPVIAALASFWGKNDDAEKD